MNKKTVLILLILIIILGGALRLIGTDFGLPYYPNPDEAFFVNPSFNILALKTPGWYGAPGTTNIYLDSIILFVVGNVLDHDTSILTQYQADPTLFMLIARIIYALIGTASIFLIYWLSQKLFKKYTLSLLATLGLSLSVLHVEHSHYIRPDILMTFFILLTALFSIYIWQTGKLKHYILAGIMLALAVATKYPAILAIIFILTGHYLYCKENKQKFFNKKIILAGIISLASFLIIFPYILIDAKTVFNNLLWESRSEHAGADSLGFFGNFEFYIQGSLWYAGTFIFIASIIGAIYAFIKRRKEILFLGSFILLFIIFISALSLHWDRWLLPILPFSLILSALGIYQTFIYLRKKISRKLKTTNKYFYGILTIICLLIIFYPAALRSIRQTNNFYQVDTQEIAREWIITNLPREARVVYEDYTPKVDDYFAYAEHSWTSSLKFPGYWKNDKNLDYQIVSSLMYERILAGPADRQYYKDSYDRLFETKELIYEIKPKFTREDYLEKNDFELLFSKNIFNFKSQAGPTLKIYQL